MRRCRPVLHPLRWLSLTLVNSPTEFPLHDFQRNGDPALLPPEIKNMAGQWARLDMVANVALARTAGACVAHLVRQRPVTMYAPEEEW